MFLSHLKGGIEQTHLLLFIWENEQEITLSQGKPYLTYITSIQNCIRFKTLQEEIVASTLLVQYFHWELKVTPTFEMKYYSTSCPKYQKCYPLTSCPKYWKLPRICCIWKVISWILSVREKYYFYERNLSQISVFGISYYDYTIKLFHVGLSGQVGVSMSGILIKLFHVGFKLKEAGGLINDLCYNNFDQRLKLNTYLILFCLVILETKIYNVLRYAFFWVWIVWWGWVRVWLTDSALLSSRRTKRASAQTVTSKWHLCATSPVITYSLAVENR